MRTAIQLSADAAPWPQLVDFVIESEKLGVDMVWVAEAWGGDAPSPLGYLSAVTHRMQLGSGVMQVGVRSAVMTAQTAITLANLSGGRFVLGLGASGPQVMEGLHGVPFAHPRGRISETLDVIAQVFAGEKVHYEGRHIELPLPGGEGKSMRVAARTPHRIPIYLASLSPLMLELTGERADGWLGTSFVPEAADAYLDHLRTGAARSGRTLAEIDICQGAEVAFARDEAELKAMVDARKPGLAFSLGGMGSPSTNFYNRAYGRQGWERVAEEVQQLWTDGRRDAAAAAVPDEMVMSTTLLGTDDIVRARLRAWRDAGVTTVRLYPAGDTLDERLATLGRALELMPTSEPGD
ncbi:MAG TPA: LLM class flavin-dependent oxidoreductase [Acidimicrobiales bacterium]|jgi:F420-dependent oxidoreductase-like protein